MAPQDSLIEGTERSEGKRYSPTLFCVCGHTKEQHEKQYGGKCWYEGHDSKLYPHPCEEFKLDNLSLVEDLAKERGLV